MTMKFDKYFRPETLDEAFALLQEYGDDCKIVGGGTDVIIRLKTQVLKVKAIIDISAIPELKEVKVEEPAAIEETEKPIRKKPRVRRAGETSAAATATAGAVTSVEETFEAPPIELMEVSTSRVTPKRPAGKPDLPQKKTTGRTGAPHKKPTGARPAGRPAHRPEAKSPSAKPLRSKAAEQTSESRKAPEETAEQSKRSFAPLEKMRKKLARKWS